MKNKETKVLIVGHGRHGKDTLAGLINLEMGLKFRGSSQVAAAEVIYPLMSNFYTSPEDAFERRHENRELWRALISDYNREDPTRLSRLVCANGHGYTGLRDKTEVISCIKQGVFTHVIWIERPDLAQDDPTMMFTLEDIEKLHRNGYCKNLAYVQNHTEDVLLDVVENELKHFLENTLTDEPFYLKVTRNKKLKKVKKSAS